MPAAPQQRQQVHSLTPPFGAKYSSGHGITYFIRTQCRILADFWPVSLCLLLTNGLTYLIYPAFLHHLPPWKTVGANWYPLILNLVYALGDVSGKLHHVWTPPHPQATLLDLSLARVPLLLVPFQVGLSSGAGPAVFILGTLLLSLSSWYKPLLFEMPRSMHPRDVHMVESLLALVLDVAIILGSLASLAWVKLL